MVKYRAEQITFDIPREDYEAWINIVIQEVIKDIDGTVTNIIPRKGFVNKASSAVSTNIYEYADPILGGELRQISGAGVYYAIADVVIKLMQEKFGGTIVNGELIMEG